jgi:uncharacterized protein YkwD
MVDTRRTRARARTVTLGLLILVAATPASETGVSADLFDRIDETRIAEGLPALLRALDLDHVATLRAADIAAEPEERRLSPSTSLRELLRDEPGLGHRRVFELVDLQRLDQDPVEAAWRAWLHHPPSWELIVEPRVESVGIATRRAEDGTLVLVALFLESQQLPTDLRALEERAEAMINDARVAAGLKPLRPRDAIRRVAREHSDDMATRDFFDHETPDGDSPGDRATAAGLGYKAVAENIGQSLEMEDPVAAVVDGWLNSPGHYANVMNPRFRHTGVGVAISEERGRIYFTQLFVQPGPEPRR